jgi:hypothetical protein
MRKIRRSNAYYRANPLSTLEIGIGAAVAAVVVGVGGYLLYQKYGAPSTTAQGLPAPVPWSTGPAMPGTTDQQQAANLTGPYTVPPAPPGGAAYTGYPVPAGLDPGYQGQPTAGG